jgi:hypothetical protein
MKKHHAVFCRLAAGDNILKLTDLFNLFAGSKEIRSKNDDGCCAVPHGLYQESR